jgi:cob(I)alamin adenosyltransferase
MSITTKGGDGGTTSLLFGRRVPKNHPRVEAYGTVDELSAALGLVRAALAPEAPSKEMIRRIQHDLISLMAECAVDEADLERWLKKEPRRLDDADVSSLENEIQTRESLLEHMREFDLPGENELHARCHLARTLCRRSERALVAMRDVHGIPLRAPLTRYLNRLADLLWLLGREALAE